MKHLLSSAVVSLLIAGALSAQNVQPNPNRPLRPRAQAPVADMVEGLFIGQFQEQVQVSDEQYVKILPLLRQGIDALRTNANRSLVAQNRLRQLINSSANEDALNAQIQEVDEADRQTRAAQQLFLSKIDPFLTTVQKARFRMFQSTFDQRLRELVVRARQLNRLGNQQQPAAPR